jgi:hypothetical protein
MGSLPIVTVRVAAWAALTGRWLLAACLCGSLVSPLWAGEVRVVEARGADEVVIEAADAAVDDVLAVLARQFQFAVERSAPSGQAMRFSGRLQGSLDQLLERLLRNEGHMIVRSSEASAGISRVVLFKAKAGVVSSYPLSGPIAAIKAKLREREEAKQ